MRRTACLVTGVVLVALMTACHHGGNGTPVAATSSVAVAAPGGGLASVPATTVPATSQASSCPMKIEGFTSPNKDASTGVIKVSQGRKGFTVTVTMSCVPQTAHIWMFDRNTAPDTDDPKLYMDDGLHAAPSEVGYGPHVTYTDKPVGDNIPDLENEPYELVVMVDANDACHKVLTSVKPDGNGDYTLSKPPVQCAPVAAIPFVVAKY